MSTFDSANIEYPALWHGRVVVLADCADAAEEGLRLALLAFGVAQPPVRANVSRNGTYITFAVRATILDAAMMVALPEALAQVEGVRMLL